MKKFQSLSSVYNFQSIYLETAVHRTSYATLRSGKDVSIYCLQCCFELSIFSLTNHWKMFTLDSEFRLPLGERPEVKEGRRVQIQIDCLKKFGKSLCSSTWSCFWQYLVEVEIKWASPRWSWMPFFLSQEDRGIT